MAAEREASSAVARNAELISHTGYASVHALPINVREQLAADLRRVEEQRLALGRAEGGWQEVALEDLTAGRRARWDTIVGVSIPRQSRGL